MTALRTGVAKTGPAACLIRGVVLVVALGGRAAADGADAGGVPDLGQVPQLDAGVVAAGLMAVVAGVGGDRVDRDDQVRPGSGGVQPPGAVPARRAVPAGGSKGEPRRAGAGALPVTPGFGAGAAVGDGVALVVGDGQAPGGLRVGCGGGGEVAGQPRVDRAQPGELAGTVGQAGQGGQRRGQRDPAGEPAGPAPAAVPGRESLPSSRSR